jgi:hypothetical protein
MQDNRQQEPFTHHVLIVQFPHNIFSQRLESPASSPAVLVAAPLQAPLVLSNIVPRARNCWTCGPLGRNQDKNPVSHVT